LFKMGNPFAKMSDTLIDFFFTDKCWKLTSCDQKTKWVFKTEREPN
jgi:hypothetical protein